jgi:acyl-CoA synthetase (AMP-forming)/AMP-acid ligase II
MASNPLPGRVPGLERRAGTVGVAAGAEIRILDPEGRPLTAGERGEVAIRGAGVTLGYVENPEANAAAFSDGWFRTGDEGYLGEDGALTLTGRLKELINRGGEKVAPLEVDDALLQHPAVAQAVAFAVPHPKLGEEVGAAVVLAEGQVVEASELRAFAAERLAAFKVPRSIVIVDEIPKGPTGKLQRIGLAERLGLA